MEMDIAALRTLVGGWAQAEIDAGAYPQAWDDGARARVAAAIGAFGATLEDDSERERQAAIVWDQTWLEALAEEVRHAQHEASVKAAIAKYNQFKKLVPQRW